MLSERNEVYQSLDVGARFAQHPGRDLSVNNPGRDIGIVGRDLTPAVSTILSCDLDESQIFATESFYACNLGARHN